MLATIFALVVSAGALLFVVWPLLRRQSFVDRQTGGTAELLNQRDLALNDIKELDFDRDLGNLSEEDHRELRERYKRRAVAILRQLNAQDHQIDDEIERAVAELRQRSSRQA